ncbi:Capsular polysaccharide export system protein KpsC [Acidisarcina polymorpha]|uniref:Capsular polysaccharide export system protein KpsC n=1 Tax=Acidisarcina polymorpha TaxID=2211140 RepID=A0A2Z5FWZ3_9BACT|nr:SLBB domain-containing protein [Acidisarcina polymorpha]AXC10916.1 Capsular polysaccharide export system protein KpsC [Acidisarcina polymorpha]
MLNRSVYLGFAALLTFTLGSSSFAQSTLGNTGIDAQQGIDCADPLNANSETCQVGRGQNNQNQQNSYQNSQQFPNSGSSPQNGRSGVPGTQNPTFSDNGGVNGANAANARNSAPLPFPQEPLTEFQKLVASTTQQLLPIYGQDLFQGVPSTFAPVDQIPVTPDYVIGPGDEIRIRVWGQVNFNADLKVDRSGDVYLPQVGRIHVTGYAFSDLSQQIRSQIARVYRNFDLTVDLGQLRSIQIFVVGQARRPGAYTVSSLSTLVNALFASGGPSVQGTMRDIQLKREGKVISDFDLYDLLIRGDKSQDARLLPGDVIYIPAAGPQVALMGSVRKPAIYELRGGAGATTIQQLIDSAGGLSAIASGSRISVERIENHQNRFAMEVALDATGLATPLQDGDVLRVISIVPGFGKTVTLRGNLANPGRFAWHEGMKLSDLIPDRASLITRNYWWHRVQLGLPGFEFQPLEGRGALYQPSHPGYLPKQQTFPLNGTFNGVPAAPGTQWNRPDSPSSGQTPDLGNGQFSGNLAPSSPTANANAPSYPGQQRGDSLAAQAEASGSTLAGQQSQIVTQNVATAGQKFDVRLSAPEIDWSYAVIERLDPSSLKTSLLSFNLGKLVIDHDPTQDLPIQPGDVVTIFSQADIRVPLEQQTKFVRLEGEFVSAGIYSVGPGETLRQLVERAGGFTPNAYLFGSEFTRESTRVFQQQRLDEYVQSLELQTQRGSINLAAAAVSPQDTAAANAANISQQALLTRLHQLRATGRIVLEVKPNSTGVDSIPDLPLQDDDRFVVPPVPASINVVGSVYNQNSFIYQSSRRVGDYLRLAGGPNREADKKHIFVIRADGSVYSRATANGLWGNNFEAMRLNPGDSIVVPEKTVGASAVRGFINWSQIFSQLAIGAAAINIL